ncbi:hypothetical protein LSAT2_019131 [Lamellibrachia satsuma]|nr:hypothetical protein LSAT2_019131 [Lamellibrachia satsuma]
MFGMYSNAAVLLRLVVVTSACSWTIVTSVEDVGVVCKLLVGTDRGMLEIPVNTSTTPPLFGRPRQFIAGNVWGVAVDNVHGYIYWSDTSKQTVNRANLDGSEQISIASGRVYALALHPEKSKLFFATNDEVGVINVDGSNRTTIYNRDSQESRLYGLTIDDKQRLIFFASAHNIRKVNFDGSENEVIVSSQSMWLRGLAINHNARHICWADSENDVIECSNYDGQHRVVIRSNTLDPFNLQIEDNVLYWTDNQPRR